jgi:hypothetical protein
LAPFRDIPSESRCRVPSAIAAAHAAAPRRCGGLVNSGDFLGHAGWPGEVAITGQSVIGDQIRVPIAGCAMAGCEAAFADPAALGEADNRARAVAAGWAKDDLGRLVCPGCQRDRPVPPWWVYSREPRPVTQEPRPVTQEPRPVSQERRPVSQERAAVAAHSRAASAPWPAVSAPWPAGGMGQPAGLAAAGGPPAGEGRQHRAQWPRLLSALVSSRDGSASRREQSMPAAGRSARLPPGWRRGREERLRLRPVDLPGRSGLPAPGGGDPAR